MLHEFIKIYYQDGVGGGSVLSRQKLTWVIELYSENLFLHPGFFGVWSISLWVKVRK